jgi:hypothetical protein
MSAMYNDIIIKFNLNELVSIRSKVLKLEMTEDDIDEVAIDARIRLTWDTMYGMIDDLILEYMDEENPKKAHYGEIQPEPGREKELMRLEKEAKERKAYFEKNFELVDLVAPAWTIQVPRRKT